jgi:large repetitive protein
MTIHSLEQFLYRIPSDSYTDADGHTLYVDSDHLAENNLKPWLRFNPASWTFSGVPPIQVSGSYNITVTITDTFTGGTVTDTFLLTVNGKPTQHLTNGFILSTYVFP